MRLSHFVPKIGLALLLSASCNDGPKVSGTDTGTSLIKTCVKNCDGPDSNGDDLFQPYQGLGTGFTMTHGSDWAGWVYKATGFYLDSIAKIWMVRGYYVYTPTGAHKLYDAPVTMSTSDSIQHKIIQIDAPPTVATMAVTFCVDATCGIANTATDRDLTKIALHFTIAGRPGVLRAPEAPFKLTFTGDWLRPDEPTDRYSDDVMGIIVNWETNGVLPSPLCKGPGGIAQLMVPQANNLWDPATFKRAMPPTPAVTIACEKGAITYCRLWGYWEGYEFKMKDGSAVDKGAVQQACINMKVANYCGTGPTQTKYGTKILFSDPVDTTRHGDMSSTPEAIWTENGALCDNGPMKHRHPEIPNPAGCSLMPCSAADWGDHTKTNFISYLP